MFITRADISMHLQIIDVKKKKIDNLYQNCFMTQQICVQYFILHILGLLAFHTFLNSMN